MIRNKNHDHREGHLDDHFPHVHVRVPPPKGTGSWRWLGRLLLVCVSLFLISFFVLVFAIQALEGTSGKDGKINQRVEAGLQAVVGPNYTIKVGQSELALRLPAVVFISANDVVVSTKEGEKVATIEHLNIELQTMSLMAEKMRFSDISVFNVSVFNDSIATTSNDTSIVLPKSFGAMLNSTGEGLSRLQTGFNENQFSSLNISGLKVNTQNKNSSLKDINLSLLPTDKRGMKLDVAGHWGAAPIELEANYRQQLTGNSGLVVKAKGLKTVDWLWPLDAVEGPIGLDTSWNMDAVFPFNQHLKSLQPLIKLTTPGGRVRLGKAKPFAMQPATINLRFIPVAEEFALERSLVGFDGLEAKITGFVRPKFLNEGYHGPLEVALNGEKLTARPSTSNEKPATAQFEASGEYDIATTTLDIPNWKVKAENGSINGNVQFVFSDSTPAIKSDLKGTNLPVRVIRQFWPDFVAHKGRDWMRKNAISGVVTTVKGSFDIPAGKIKLVSQEKAKYSPKELALSAAFKGATIKTFGQIAPLEGANGTFKLSGAKLSAGVENAKIGKGGGNGVDISKGQFNIDDLSLKPATASLQANFSGSSADLLKVTSATPIDLDKRIDLQGASIEGKAKGKLTARFPVAPKIKGDQINWKAQVSLSDFSSSKPIFDHKIAEGKLEIVAEPTGVTATGKARLDGAMANVDLSQPFGKSSNFKKKTEVSLVLDASARKQLGLNFDQFLKGTIKVAVEQAANGATKETLDLTDADLFVDALSWKKGSGIPATASYTRTLKDGVFHISDFKFSGQGFGAKGKITFGKKGLLSANLNSVKLNKGDNAAVEAVLRDGIYRVNITGKTWDVRGILSKLFREGGFAESQGGVSLNLQANLAHIQGFQGRGISNMTLDYKVRDGSLRSLELKGVMTRNGKSTGKLVTGNATKQSPITDFVIASDSAGDTVAFANLYKHMVGGTMSINLRRRGDGPFVGPMKFENFKIVDEPKLAKLVASKTVRGRDNVTQKLKTIKTRSVKFIDGTAKVEKGDRYLKIKDGILRAVEFGIVSEGMIYDQKDRTNIRGTFLPAFGISMAVSAIPLVGKIFSNGKDSGLLGITYKMSGPYTNPKLVVNPMSLVAPGVFNKVFEFRK